MLTRLRSTWLAGGGAMLLILSLSGIAAGATLVADTTDPVVDPADPPTTTTDTTLTFTDVDGNGIEDSCQDVAAVVDPVAAAAALAAADLDGDGKISVSEAARTDWIGGPNCNHGGYVSGVAGGSDDATTDPATTDTAPADCSAVAPAAPVVNAPVDTSPNAHGTAVSEVAQSDAVGGKNCNHGGAVSAAAHQDGVSNGNAAAKAHGKAKSAHHGKGHGSAQD